MQVVVSWRPRVVGAPRTFQIWHGIAGRHLCGQRGETAGHIASDVGLVSFAFLAAEELVERDQSVAERFEAQRTRDRQRASCEARMDGACGRKHLGALEAAWIDLHGVSGAGVDFDAGGDELARVVIDRDGPRAEQGGDGVDDERRDELRRGPAERRFHTGVRVALKPPLD